MSQIRRDEPVARETTGDRWFLVVIVLFALVLRIGLAQLDRVIKWDESDYLMLGRNLLAGRGYTTAGYPEVHYPPLLPLTLGLAQLATSDPEVASEIVYALFGALLMIPFHALALRTQGRRVARAASILLALFPSLAVSVLYWGTMSEPLYLFLIYGGLLGLWRGLQSARWPWHALAGLSFGLAYLTRPDAILYWGVFLGVLILWQLGRGKRGNTAWWRGALIYVLAFALCALPYIHYLWRTTGQVTFTGKVGVTYDLGAAVIEQDPAAYDRATARLDDTGQHIIWFSPQRFETGQMGSQVLGDIPALVRRMAANLGLWEGQFFRKSIFPYAALGLVALGLFQRGWDRERTWREAFLIAALVPPFGFLALHMELRFFAPLFPILLLWSARGLVALGDWLVETITNWRAGRTLGVRAETALRLVLPTMAAVYLAAMLPVAARAGQSVTDTGAREVGLWLRENTPASARVLSRDVAIAVYADRAWVPSPHAEYEAYIDYARYHEADYLVITQREAETLRPSLRFLLDQRPLPAELNLAHVTETGHGKTFVFELD